MLSRGANEDNFIFMQDKTPLKTSRSAKEYMEKEEIAILDLPLCLPDLKPHENSWNRLKKRITTIPDNLRNIELLIQAECE